MKRYRQNMESMDTGKMVLLGAVVLVVVIVSLAAFNSYNTFHSRTLQVCSKERVATQDGGEYRIYTDGGTFVMSDILIGGTRFDTADAYGRIHEGQVYDLTYKGWRQPFFSMFENIIEAKPAAEAIKSSGSGC